MIGFLDYKTGFELSFSSFYLIPIIYISWFLGHKQGIIISLFASGTCFTADFLSGHEYTHWLIQYWNTLIRFTFFVIISYLLCKVKTLLHKEHDYARVDYLTGLANTRAFFEYAEKVIKRAKINNDSVTAIYIDLDNFKKVNDTEGHKTGDQLLQKVAYIIQQNIRTNDIAARLGGDEFALLIPHIDERRAEEFVKDVTSKLNKEMSCNNWPVTFSVGIAVFQKVPETIDEIIKEADSLMYTVKKSGKNSHVKKIINNNSII